MAREAGRGGRVVATCSWPARGIPKQPQPEVRVGPLGIVGDFHAGPVDRHARRGKPRPNERQISIVAQEVTEAVSRELGIELQPGDLGENFLVRGLGDLSDLRPGDRIRLGESVEVEVTAQNKPCTTLNVLGPGIGRALKRRRGVVGVVRAQGIVRPGDPAAIVRAPASEPASAPEPAPGS